MATIEEMYQAQYDARQKEYEKAKRKQLEALTTEEKSYDNAYNSAKKEIEMNRTNTANKYKEMYNQLQNRYAEGKQGYYNDRDNASVSNAKNTQAIRDYMARNNLLQSGESVDAQLRNNTDFSNTMGSIRDNENAFEKNIFDTRSGYERDEQSAYSQLDKSLADALAEYNLNKGRIAQARTSAEQDYLDSISALTKEIEASKIQALLNASYSSGGGSSRGYSSRSGSSSGSSSYKEAINELKNDYNNSIKNGYSREAQNLLGIGLKAYADGYMSVKDYNAMVKKMNEAEAKNKTRQAQIMKTRYGY